MVPVKPEVLTKGTTDEERAMIRCPGCDGIGWIDDDQYHGRVSIWCDCGYHETHDLSGD